MGLQWGQSHAPGVVASGRLRWLAVLAWWGFSRGVPEGFAVSKPKSNATEIISPANLPLEFNDAGRRRSLSAMELKCEGTIWSICGGLRTDRERHGPQRTHKGSSFKEALLRGSPKANLRAHSAWLILDRNKWHPHPKRHTAFPAHGTTGDF